MGEIDFVIKLFFGGWNKEGEKDGARDISFAHK